MKTVFLAMLIGFSGAVWGSPDLTPLRWDEFDPKIPMNEIVSKQTKVQRLAWDMDHPGVKKKLNDVYFHLELRKATALASQKQSRKALQSYVRFLSELNSFKWVWMWRAQDSEGLVKVCEKPFTGKDQKDRAQECLWAVRKVIEAFPKPAIETKKLREKFESKLDSLQEFNAERLNATYTEKTEKDEVAFEPILYAYLQGKPGDVIDLAKKWMEDFPRSSLRARVQFLWAESLWEKEKKDEAKTIFQKVISEFPLGYYAVVARERLQMSLKDSVQKPKESALKGDLEFLNPKEKNAWSIFLEKGKKLDEESFTALGESLTRLRQYPENFLIQWSFIGHQAKADLDVFRLANELIQRRSDILLREDYLKILFPNRFRNWIDPVSAQNKVDPLWVLSLMKQESGFRASALSSSGAMGLMQVMPFTALEVDRGLSLADARKPEVIIRLGVQYLGSLFQKFNQNPVYALAGYNAGPHRVTKWKKEIQPHWTILHFIESIPYRETRDYVMSILRNRLFYQYLLGGEAPKVLDIKLAP